MNIHKKHILEDFLLMVFSIVFAVFIAETGTVVYIIDCLGSYTYLGIFAAGLFFSSVFTTPPAVAMLGAFSFFVNPIAVALVGAFGAMISDYFMFLVVKDRIYDDLNYLIKAKKVERYFHIFRSRAFRRIIPIIGAFIIASPLPDELGVAMLGLSKTDNKKFLLISFMFNAIGIFIIGLVARALI